MRNLVNLRNSKCQSRVMKSFFRWRNQTQKGLSKPLSNLTCLFECKKLT